MELSERIDCQAELSAVVIRADGTREDCGILSRTSMQAFAAKLGRWYRKLARWMGMGAAIALIAGLMSSGNLPPWTMALLSVGLVTDTGVAYMASDFASAGATPTISGFKYHDCGEGTTSAAVTDTALQTAAGTARVVGTPTNPSANVYRTAATITFAGTKAITEWGLFSASSSGTMWDHRIFTSIGVAAADSILFTYSLTISSGGS